jgi:hypothetical protein
MRLALLAALLALAVPVGAASAAAPPRVPTLVVGRAGVPLHSVVSVRARAVRVAVGRRRCAVAAATPLAALAALRAAHGPAFRVRDYGACGRRAADATGLYVFRIGGDRGRGQDGWVYKVGRRAGTAGAADPSGPFGTGRRLRTGQRLLWFWCRMVRGGCQRTLALAPAQRRVAHASTLRVTVRGYDDRGRGVPVAGASVTLDGVVVATTDGTGVAELGAPQAARTIALTAVRAGLVPSFPEEVAVT